MFYVSTNDISKHKIIKIQLITINNEYTHLTGPNLFNVSLVRELKGVDANTQTSPLVSLTAVDRPPTGMKENLKKGLCIREIS